jgi:hypothetical protein
LPAPELEFPFEFLVNGFAQLCHQRVEIDLGHLEKLLLDFFLAERDRGLDMGRRRRHRPARLFFGGHCGAVGFLLPFAGSLLADGLGCIFRNRGLCGCGPARLRHLGGWPAGVNNLLVWGRFIALVDQEDDHA